MTSTIVLLVLFAALLHATWNAVLKGGADRLWSMNVMGLASALACAVLLPFTPLPATTSWPCIAGSALLHVGYNVFLIRAYRSGDFGTAYPIARGSSPLLVTLGAALAAKEWPSASGIAGIVLVSGGIISLAFQGRRLREAGIFYALGTGAFIAAYSVTDGIGGRLSGNTLAYTLWMSLFSGMSTLPIYLVRRRGEAIWRGWRETGLAAGGGIISLLAYGIVIFAMTRAPMGSVSALRETSVLFAILLARIFFAEKLTARRIGSVLVIALGALCLE
ncbi:MAG TPA: DMT family transporter [Rhizomicrobium sp.]|jgi:drug/metabolite transporter (DMT)-like permease|nr:DMT family transporter [Rhizomicrobium sp.]